MPDIGFNDLSTFYNPFRKFTGVMPTEYRERSGAPARAAPAIFAGPRCPSQQAAEFPARPVEVSTWNH